MAFFPRDPTSPRPERPFRAVVLEPRSGSCAVMVRAIEAAGGIVDVMRTIDDARNGWLGHDLLVVQAGAKDSALRRFVKWIRLSESAPFVIAVGDGMHDPRWLEDSRKGAQTSVLAPDDTLAQRAMIAARAWFAARTAAQREVAGALADVPDKRAPVPDWLPVLLDKTAAAMAVFDAGLRYRLCNRSWREMFGLHDADVTGRLFSDGFAGLSEGWREAYRRALGGETLKREDDTVVSASGVAMQVRWEIAPWRDAAGAIGGVLAVFEPRPKPQAGSEHFEISLGRSMLGAHGGWLVVQDLQGVILGTSKGFSIAAGRTGRTFGRSYWEAFKVMTTTLTPGAFAHAIREWRQTGEFAMPARVVETLRGPGGEFEITWSLLPYYLDAGVSSGVVRFGIPQRLDAGGPGAWDLPWDADGPVMSWEAGKSGMFTRIGRGFRQFVGWKDGDDHAMDEFGRLAGITPAWFQGILACLNGGRAIDAVLQVKSPAGPVAVRFIGLQAGDDIVRGWAVPLVDAPAAARSVDDLSDDTRAAAAPVPPAIEEFIDVIIFVIDGRGCVVRANSRHASLATRAARPGEEFTAWLAEAAGASPADITAWRTLGWQKHVPCTLTLQPGPAGTRRVEFTGRPAGAGQLVVTARDVTDCARPRYFFTGRPADQTGHTISPT